MSIANDIMERMHSILKTAEKIHEMAAGDVLGRIAMDNGLTMEQLYSANPDKAERWRTNPRSIQIGEKVRIPQSAVEFGTGLKGLTIDELINRSAAYAGIDAAVLKALIEQESGGNANAQSGKGAKGLGQLMDSRIKEFKVNDPFDPAQNVPVAAAYLAQVYKNAPGVGDEKLWNALVSYNWGPSAFQAWYKIQPLDMTKIPNESKKYPVEIFRKMGKEIPAVYKNWIASEVKGPMMAAK